MNSSEHYSSRVNCQCPSCAVNIGEIIETASRKVHMVYGGVYPDRDDFRQIGHIAVWRMGLHNMNSGWVYRIVKRRMIDYGRRARCRVEVIPIDELQIFDPSISPLDLTLAKEDWALIEGLHSLLLSPELRLTAKQTTAMQLYYIEGLTMLEIARRCDSTECAVKWVIHSGIRQMRIFLAKKAVNQ